MSPEVIAALSGLWAIKPEALTALTDVLALAGDLRKEAKPKDSPKTEASYSIESGIAIVPVSGSLSKNGLSFWGMTWMASMRQISATLRQAAADPSVRAILLDVDSPGGTVDGVDELAATVAAVGAQKPLYAFADGLMASAAYWLSSSAKEIAAPPTAEVGSIGVVMMQRDISKALEADGITYNIFAAGRYKTAGTPFKPLSDDMRAYLQSGIDDIYELFLQAVEQGRGVSREQALSMADGKVFLAGEALKAGLIDRVCSRESFISHIKESFFMNLAELKAQHPNLVAELTAQLQAENAAASATATAADVEAARAAASSAEQSRMVALAQAILGEAAASRLQVVAASGVAPEVLTSLQGVLGQGVLGQGVQGAPVSAEAKPDAQKAALDALKAAAVAAPLTPAAALGEAETPVDFGALVDAHMEKKGVSRGEAIKAMAAAHPDKHEAWISAQQKGAK